MSQAPAAVRLTLLALALCGLTAFGLALTVFQSTSSQAVATQDCMAEGTLEELPGATVDFNPTSGAAGAPFTAMLSGAPQNFEALEDATEIRVGLC